jgi:adenylosuccinate lyase
MMLALKLPEPKAYAGYDGIDPLDGRYYDAESARYLSERSRVAYQAYVETALAYTLADNELCSLETARSIEQAALKVTIEDVYREEDNTKHDIKALVNCIRTHLDPAAGAYVHFGATSNDIISTALALQLKTAMRELVLPRLKVLLKTLAELTGAYADTPQIGRTHGQHAVPITFGFAMAEYVSRLSVNTKAIDALSDELCGKFSGAVGAYNALGLFVRDPLKFEASLLKRLKLKTAPYSTQIVPPEGLIRLIDELVISAGIMANLAHDMRHLQRSEINEIRERFEKGQTGSSTMAHKRNPWNFENVISMSKQVTAQIINANLNLSSEHQRDLTDSASSRFYMIVPALVASMAGRLDRIMSKLEVDAEAMRRNLHLSGGAIAAEPFYLLLAKYGHPGAHEKAKELAHKALEHKAALADIIAEDSEAVSYWRRFTAQERQIIAEPEKYYTGLAAKKARLIIRNS